MTVAYVLVGKLGLSLARIHPSASSVWPATGVAIAALLVLGTRFFPAILVGAFLVNVTTFGNVATSIGIATGNALEAAAAAWLIGRFAGGRDAFDHPRSFFRFLLYGAAASTTISATIGVGSLALAGLVQSGQFNSVWVTWWLGDAVGAVMFAPLLVLWLGPQLAWNRVRALEAALLLAGLLLVAWACFGPLLTGARNYPLTLAPIPFLIWAAFRFGPRETATANLILGAIAIWGTLEGCGPFADLPQHESLLVLQIFLGFMAGIALTLAVVAKESRDTATALRASEEALEQKILERTARLLEANAGLAAEIDERVAAQSGLAESEAKFRDLVESAPDAVVIVGREGRIEIVNSQTERFFGYRRDELIGQWVEILVPERYRDRHVFNRAGYFANPHVRAMGEGLDLFGRRKDGSEFPVDISLSPLQTKGGQMVSAAIRDVTRRRRAELERLANQNLRGQVAELSRRTAEIATLNRMNNMLRAAMSLDDACSLVPQFLEELFRGDSGAMYAFNESRIFLEAVATWGKSPPEEEILKPDECWALRRGQSYQIEDPKAGVVCPHLKPPLPAMSLCIPMTALGETLGLFCLCRPQATPSAGAGDGAVLADDRDYRLKLAQAAAEQLAGALGSVKLQEKLRSQAIRDPLTGLFNRRSFDESLERELHRAARRKTTLGLLMIDLDHFKRFNDRFGHAAGDLALREIGGFLLRHSRKEDVVCRFGGEEIAIVLADCSPKDGQRRSEEIREGVGRLGLEHEGRSLGTITLSIGMAFFPDHGRTAEELLRAADEALYRAKGAGRNRLAIAAATPFVPDSKKS